LSPANGVDASNAPTEITVDRQEYETLLGLLIAEARDQLDTQMATSDSQVAKSLGIVAADLAGVGLLVVSRSALNRFWLASALGLLFSAGCLLATVGWRALLDGPDVAKFYEDHLGEPASTTKYAMYLGLLQSLNKNKASLKGWRRRVFFGGVLALVVTALASAIYLPVVG
jgi:hypothetical protein